MKSASLLYSENNRNENQRVPSKKPRHFLSFNTCLPENTFVWNIHRQDGGKKIKNNPEHIEMSQSVIAYRQAEKVVKVSKYISYRTNYKIWEPFG